MCPEFGGDPEQDGVSAVDIEKGSLLHSSGR